MERRRERGRERERERGRKIDRVKEKIQVILITFGLAK